MKALKFGFLLALLAAPFFLYSNFKPRPERPVEVTVQGNAALNQLDVLVNKSPETPLTLRVLTQSGWTLHEGPIAHQAANAKASVNLCGLPDGQYVVEVSDRHQTHTHTMRLSAATNSLTTRQIDIWPVE